jgi:chloride channel 2
MAWHGRRFMEIQLPGECKQSSAYIFQAVELLSICMVWYGMVWYGMVWYGMVWYGMVWYGK